MTNKKSLNNLIVEASETIRQINAHSEYKNLILGKDEAYAPAADAYCAIAEISGALHKKEKGIQE